MYNLIKPITAAVLLSIASSSAFANISSNNSTKSPDCGVSADSVLNPNGARYLDHCFGGVLAFGGDANILATNIYQGPNIAEADGGNDSGSNISFRYLAIDSALSVNKSTAVYLSLSGYSSLEDNVIDSDDDFSSNFDITQAYVVLKDFSEAPVSVMFGRAWAPLGNYSNAYPSAYSLNTSIVTSYNTYLAVAAPIDGVNVSGFMYENEFTDKFNQWGARVDYDGISNVHLNASYVNNISSLNGYASDKYNDFDDADGGSPNLDRSINNQNTAALDIYAGVDYGSYKGHLEYFSVDKSLSSSVSGTKPSIVSVGLEYDATIFGKNGDIHGMFEQSFDAENVITTDFANFDVFPEYHATIGASIDLAKNVSAGLDLHYMGQYADNPTNDDQIFVNAELKIKL